MWIYFIIGIILIVIGVILVSPLFKGLFGEFIVKIKLKSLLQKDEHLIHDVIIKDKESDRTTQIDFVMFSKKGVFVFEVKNYNGEIYGDEQNENFTQVFPNGKKNTFYSPIRQNNTHITYLNKYDIKNIKKYNIIIFLKNNFNHVKSNKVYNVNQFIRFYKSLPDLYTNEYDGLHYQIYLFKLNPPKTKKEHIENVKETIVKKEQKIKKGICPRCGAKLKLVNGKYGAFYGCTNYPKCKYTRKIES